MLDECFTRRKIGGSVKDVLMVARWRSAIMFF